MADKPTFPVGTVLALSSDWRDKTMSLGNRQWIGKSKAVVLEMSPKNVPVVIDYKRWHPNMTRTNNYAGVKIMHWAPVLAAEVEHFTWENENGTRYELPPCGWSVYGLCSSICPDQTLPLLEVYELNAHLIYKVPPAPEKVNYPVGTHLSTEHGHNSGRLFWKQWVVVSHTAKGAARVTREINGQITDDTAKPLRWTKQGWKLGAYLIGPARPLPQPAAVELEIN